MGKLLTRSLRLACTTAADAPVNSSVSDVYVPQRHGISHRPDGKMADAMPEMVGGFVCVPGNHVQLDKLN